MSVAQISASSGECGLTLLRRARRAVAKSINNGPTEFDLLFESILDAHFGPNPNSKYKRWIRRLRRHGLIPVFGSRMMEQGQARRGGMPFYKFVGNKILTGIQNALLGASFTEFHSGYRVYSVAALKAVPFDRNTNIFHFDTEIIIQLLFANKRIIELPIPTYYGDEICYVNGMKYAGAVIKASLQAKLQSVNLFYDRRFDWRCSPT